MNAKAVLLAPIAANLAATAALCAGAFEATGAVVTALAGVAAAVVAKAVVGATAIVLASVCAEVGAGFDR